MKIKHKLQPSQGEYELLNEVDLRVEPSIRVQPLSVQIESSQVGPEVSIDHPIRVDHWKHNDFEPCCEQRTAIFKEGAQERFHEEGTHRLAGVLPRQYEYLPAIDSWVDSE